MRDLRKEAEEYLDQDQALTSDDDRSVVERAADITKRAKERDALHGGESREMGSADTRGQEDDDQGGVSEMAISDDQFSRMRADAQSESVTCPKCNKTSHNPNDVENGYCGNCHAYTSPVNTFMQAKRIIQDNKKPTRDLIDNMREDNALGKVTGDPTIPKPSDE